jgi:hypothetical protein
MLFILIGLTSCGDIVQDLKLNPDGSGTLETSFDVGEMMSMVNGMGEMGDLNNEDVTISTDQEKSTAPTPPAEPESKDPMDNIIKRVTDPAYPHDFDTLMTLESIMPDSVKKEQKRMDLVKKMKLHLTSPANSASLVFGIVMDFKSDKELKEMIQYLENMDSQGTGSMLSAGGTGGGLDAENFMVFEADMKKGIIKVDSMDYSGMTGEMSMGMASDTTSGSENMAMMEMMFGNTKIKSTIHVPGEVISCSNKDAILTKDNKVIVEYPFMDVLKKGKLPGYTIQFTPAKK